MKDEIKEILDKLAKKSSIYKAQISRGTSFNTDEYEANILLDYITNLQEERNLYENEVSSWEGRADYAEERIDKAIEYIKEKARNNCWIDQYEANDLINILQGSDKE